MLFDENELSDNETKKFMAKSGTGPGRKKGPSKKDSKKDTGKNFIIIDLKAQNVSLVPFPSSI